MKTEIGALHGLALKLDGSIVGWSYDEWDQCRATAPNTGYIDISGDGSAIRSSLVGAGPDLAQPRMMALQPNYPNPFNPTTKIEFILPEAGIVQVAAGVQLLCYNRYD